MIDDSFVVLWIGSFDLATALEKDTGADTTTLSDRELAKEVDRALPVKYTVTCNANGELEKVVLSQLVSSLTIP